ncbi:L-histidine N(alpha)-methyltransferase [Roseivivax isoporae]|uniref:Methyltransferase n=1 Tax=Roseivivax isoporae LMG 25204 TaxID=1449351 RepID=X7F885_9RHOB|nr:L-histidine N(alpha)-methyltransferase [Roseivivax isoporae]ETX29000.1 methyltransferase [Roseivivax isoporae LMG 25204]
MNRPMTVNAALVAEALDGLRSDPKVLHPKWFYDSAGSALFERITELPEYYPTRTEVGILRAHVDALARHVPEDAALIELGSGASTKTRILLDALRQIAVYVPVDISRDFLAGVAADLDRHYPDLVVAPVAGDIMQDLPLPEPARRRRKVGFFPGSTIGNLDPAEARALLRRARDWPYVAAFVLGVDLVKDRDTLVRAYDDRQGITAAFNRNMLHRLNREAGADFDVARFDHEARWNDDHARIEMHLVARAPQKVRIGGETVCFAPGESVRTECSHKYTRQTLGDLAGAAGWRVADMPTDEGGLFAVAILVPAPA